MALCALWQVITNHKTHRNWLSPGIGLARRIAGSTAHQLNSKYAVVLTTEFFTQGVAVARPFLHRQGVNLYEPMHRRFEACRALALIRISISMKVETARR